MDIRTGTLISRGFFHPELIDGQRLTSGGHLGRYSIKQMSWFDDRHSSWAADGFWHAARQLLFGLIGLGLITGAAIGLHLQPGATSLLYLIVIVFVSLRTGFISSLAVSLIAVLCLNYIIIPRFSS